MTEMLVSVWDIPDEFKNELQLILEFGYYVANGVIPIYDKDYSISLNDDNKFRIESTWEINDDWFTLEFIQNPQYIAFKKEKVRKSDFDQTPANLAKVLLRLLQRIQVLENKANNTNINPPVNMSAAIAYLRNDFDLNNL